MGPTPRFQPIAVLKRDLLGSVESGVLGESSQDELRAVRRLHSAARWWARPVAWILARRERRALLALDGVPGVPALLAWGGGSLVRSYIDGVTVGEARPREPAFYGAARRLLRAVHRRGVTHNDTHKEANWLVMPDGAPALVDFQLAGVHARRGAWFRMCRMEDLRHLLKHKRTHAPAALTARERAILGRKSWPARWWRRLVKPVYLAVTRGLFGWRDREGRG